MDSERTEQIESIVFSDFFKPTPEILAALKARGIDTSLTSVRQGFHPGFLQYLIDLDEKNREYTSLVGAALDVVDTPTRFSWFIDQLGSDGVDVLPIQAIQRLQVLALNPEKRISIAPVPGENNPDLSQVVSTENIVEIMPALSVADQLIASAMTVLQSRGQEVHVEPTIDAMHVFLEKLSLQETLGDDGLQDIRRAYEEIRTDFARISSGIFRIGDFDLTKLDISRIHVPSVDDPAVMFREHLREVLPKNMDQVLGDEDVCTETFAVYEGMNALSELAGFVDVVRTDMSYLSDPDWDGVLPPDIEAPFTLEQVEEIERVDAALRDLKAYEHLCTLVKQDRNLTDEEQQLLVELGELTEPRCPREEAELQEYEAYIAQRLEDGEKIEDEHKQRMDFLVEQLHDAQRKINSGCTLRGLVKDWVGSGLGDPDLMTMDPNEVVHAMRNALDGIMRSCDAFEPDKKMSDLDRSMFSIGTHIGYSPELDTMVHVSSVVSGAPIYVDAVVKADLVEKVSTWNGETFTELIPDPEQTVDGIPLTDFPEGKEPHTFVVPVVSDPYGKLKNPNQPTRSPRRDTGKSVDGPTESTQPEHSSHGPELS